MLIYVEKIHPNSDAPDINFMAVEVHFWEDEAPPYRNAQVIVFIEKSPLTVSEIETQAIEKARVFLRLAADAHCSEGHQ